MGELMLRRMAMMSGSKGDILKAVQFTQTAQTVDNYSVTAPDVSGYTFLTWVGISCDDYVGFAYCTQWLDKTTTVWAYRKPPNDTSYHNTFTALYVKNGLVDKVHMEIVVVNTTGAQNVAISAPSVDGFTFACWVGVNSSGYTGTPYISAANNVNASSWDRYNNNGKTRRCYALYFASSYTDPISLVSVNIEAAGKTVWNCSVSDVSGYVFVCWLNGFTSGFVGEPGIRNRLSMTCQLTSQASNWSAGKTIGGWALFVNESLME